MKKRFQAHTVIFLLILILLMVGCQQTVDFDQPPEFVYGQDGCDRCKMLVNEEAMATAYWTTDGEARRFDDVGCMLLYPAESGDEVASWWVHDMSSGDWINAEEATFVMNAGVSTPMGFDIVSFADRETAEALAFGVDGAMVLTFSELQSQEIRPAMMHSH